MVIKNEKIEVVILDYVRFLVEFVISLYGIGDICSRVAWLIYLSEFPEDVDSANLTSILCSVASSKECDYMLEPEIIITLKKILIRNILNFYNEEDDIDKLSDILNRIEIIVCPWFILKNPLMFGMLPKISFR